MGASERYVPALNVNWLTPLYDPFIKWFMPERRLKNALIEQAAIESGHCIMDLGCGTGTLLLLLKAEYPDTNVCGLDGDGIILRIAARKIRKAKASIFLQQGLASDLPYDARVFDRVLSSLFFHHLTEEPKDRVLAEIYRVLAPGGGLHIADFRKYNRSLSDKLGEAGFEAAKELAGFRTILGRVSMWSARKPNDVAAGSFTQLAEHVETISRKG